MESQRFMNLCVLTVAAHLVQQHSEEGVQLANHMEVSDCLVWCHACFPEFKTPRLRSSECTTPDYDWILVWVQASRI